MTERTGKEAGGTIRVFSWALLVANVLAYAALAVAVLVTLGAYERIYPQARAELPALTQAVLSLGPGGLVGILVFVVLLAVVKELVLPWPRVRLWANLAVTLICSGFWCVYCFALGLPMHMVAGIAG